MNREFALDYIRIRLERSSDRIIELVYWFVCGLTKDKN